MPSSDPKHMHICRQNPPAHPIKTNKSAKEEGITDLLVVTLPLWNCLRISLGSSVPAHLDAAPLSCADWENHSC